MNTERLIKNIIDQIKEAQIKLGYARETTRLYYPVASLCLLLEIDEKKFNINDLNANLEFQESILGKISFSGNGQRVEVSVPPDGAEYIHQYVETPEFLVSLIQLFQKNHHLKIQEIEALFASYDTDYICEKMDAEKDFDYVIYFKDGTPDSYYYCIKMEMGHTIYHRFFKEDFLSL